MLTSYREGGNHTKYQNLRIIFERLEDSNDDPKATANFYHRVLTQQQEKQIFFYLL